MGIISSALSLRFESGPLILPSHCSLCLPFMILITVLIYIFLFMCNLHISVILDWCLSFLLDCKTSTENSTW